MAAAAVVLRWGSYLAVLLDREKPVWSEALSPSTSCISDEEMARINIEASAANALVNTAWRNGPVENVHAGGYQGPVREGAESLLNEVLLLAVLVDQQED